MKLLQKNNFLLFLIILLGSFLRFFELDKYSLWKDEIFSMIEAQKSIVEIFTQNTYFFGYIPIHHFIAHLSLYFGQSDFVVRTPFVFFGILSLLLIYIIGTEIFDYKVGLIATFLLSISSLHIQYSREVRYYSPLIFFSGLTILLSYRIVSSKKKIKWLILFVIVSIIDIATQPTSIFIIFPELIYIFLSLVPKLSLKSYLRPNKHDIKVKYIRYLMIILLLFIFLFFIYYFGKSYKALVLMIKFKPAMPLVSYFESIFTSLGGSGISYYFYLSGFILEILTLILKEKGKFFLIMSTFIIPVTLIYFFRPEAVDGFNIRYISFIIIPFLLIFSNLLSKLLINKITVVLIICLLFIINLNPIKAYYQLDRGDWRGVGNYLIENTNFGDVVITDGDYNAILIAYYLKPILDKIQIKNYSQPLVPLKTPFKIYYLQHDLVNSNQPNINDLPIVEYNQLISFHPLASVSPMYIFITPEIYFWQEGENNWINNNGWNITNSFNRKTISTVATDKKSAYVSYVLYSEDKSKYKIYANIRWDGARSKLKFKINNSSWSTGLVPFYGEKGDVVKYWKMKESFLGMIELNKGKNIITFLSEKNGDDGVYQDLDYFYLIK